MKLLKQFLLEANLSDIEFYIRLNRPSYDMDKLNNAILQIEQWKSEDEILNPRYNEVKAVLSNAADSFMGGIRELFLNYIKDKEVEEAYHASGFGMQGVKSFPKKMKKYSNVPVVKQVMPVVEEFRDILVDFSNLKSKIVKTTTKRAEKKNKETQEFQAKRSSTSGMEIEAVIDEMLKDSFDSIKDRIYNMILNGVKEYAEILKDHPKASYHNYKYVPDHIRKSPFITKAIGKIANTRKSQNDDISLKPESEWSDIIDPIAEDLAKQITDGFKFKMINKMNDIIAVRNVPFKITYSGGSFGDFDVKFEDGASFLMKNDVVLKVSKLGKLFQQFPTTFRRVVLPDGTHMKQPSEAKMKKWAAGE